MTLDEAIKRAEEVAESCEIGNPKKSKSKCASEHRQLAEWLKELKALKAEPCEDAISRKAALEAILTRVPDFCCDGYGNLVGRNQAASVIRNLPSVTPKRKTGKWIDGRCSECGCDVPAYIIDWKWQKDMDAKYCPNCGIEMEGKE